MQKTVKSSSLLSYILKPSNLLTQGFENNMTSQKNLFKHMCNSGSQEEWREVRIVVSYYIDVDTTKDQFHPLIHTPLDCITGYIMEDYVGDTDLKRLPQRSLKCMDGSISSYYYIINSPERLEQIRQANKLESVLFDLESDHMR